MAVVGADLEWSSVKSGKNFAAMLSEVVAVEKGRKSPRKVSKDADGGGGARTPPPTDKCLSLIFQASTLDIEVRSRRDRDELVECMGHIANHFRGLSTV